MFRPLRKAFTCFVLSWPKACAAVSLDSLAERSSVTLSCLVQHVVWTFFDFLVYRCTLQRRMHMLSVWHTHIQCLCSAVLPNCCFGRCVRYSCWQTRFLCVRLSGSGCLTPPASPVWRQVRGGHNCNKISDLIPCEPSCCHWKPWLLYSVSAAQPWSLTKAFKAKRQAESYTHPFEWSLQISIRVYNITAMISGLCSWHWYSWPLVSVSWLMAPSLAAFWGPLSSSALSFSLSSSTLLSL